MIAEDVLVFINSQLDNPTNRETPLFMLGLDSLELLDLQIECEQKFGKRIPDEMQSKILTVGDLAGFFG